MRIRGTTRNPRSAISTATATSTWSRGIGKATSTYFENTGSATDVRFVERTGAAHSLDGESVGYVSGPSLGDLDGDGDLDMVAGAYSGTFFYFESFVRQGCRSLPWNSPARPTRSMARTSAPLAGPALADLDRDGDAASLPERTSERSSSSRTLAARSIPIFVARTGAANPLDGEDASDRARPAFADLDGDGDFDAPRRERLR